MSVDIVAEAEKSRPEFNYAKIYQSCEQQLGIVGAMLFVQFIGLSGLPTGRLFAWAKCMRSILNPTGKGSCGGKLVRTDISKWKHLVRPDGATERVSENIAVEITLSHVKLKADRQQLTVLVLFERITETLLIYYLRSNISMQTVVSLVIELEREAAKKLALPVGSPKKALLWLPRDAIYREIPANLCSQANCATGSADEHTAGTRSRTLKSINWGTGAARFYPEEWRCDWLQQPVLPIEHVLPAGFNLAQFRQQMLHFIDAFNAQAQGAPNLSRISPSIIQITRFRQVQDTVAD